ncbi:MAG: 50S ribosomal protein L25 [Candidatus Kaelpia aquatica]|nr:50S ribosomal protein L25 [Candidatus Kaelpia aquatica]
MEKLKIEVKKRDGVGKKYVKGIRKAGLIPAVLYKKGQAMPLELKEIDLIHLFREAHSENLVAELHVLSGKDKEVKTAILKEVEHDVIKGSIIHVDFQEISLDEIIKIKVPIEIKGEPVGVKKDGGVLDHLIWEIEIECKAANVPSKIEVKVDDLNIGDAIHVSDLELPQGVKALGDLEQIVAHIVTPKEVVIEEEVEGDVMREPEVISEKKEKSEEAGSEDSKKEERTG